MPVVTRSDPYGSPEPVREGAGVLSTLAVVVAGILFVMVACPMTSTSGATRSARLQWEERERLIDTAVQEQDTPVDAEPAEAGS